jgi:hypothetical protein
MREIREGTLCKESYPVITDQGENYGKINGEEIMNQTDCGI